MSNWRNIKKWTVVVGKEGFNDFMRRLTTKIYELVYCGVN